MLYDRNDPAPPEAPDADPRLEPPEPADSGDYPFPPVGSIGDRLPIEVDE